MKSGIMRYQQACLSETAIKDLDDDESTEIFLERLNEDIPSTRDDAEKCSCSFEFEMVGDNIARFGNTRHYNIFMYNLLLCPIHRITSSNTDKVRAELLRQVEGVKTFLPWRTEKDKFDNYFTNHVESTWHRLHQGSQEDITNISEEIKNIWTEHKRNVHNIIFKQLKVKSIQIGDRITFTPNDTVEFEVSQP